MDLQNLFYALGITYFSVSVIFIVLVFIVLLSFYLRLKKQIDQFKDGRLVIKKIKEWSRKPRPALLPLAVFILTFFFKEIKKARKKKTS